MAYSKDDVQFHYEQGGRPAVNVKVYGSPYDVKLPIELGTSYPVGHPELAETSYTDPGFTREWLESCADDLDWTFEAACEMGFEQLQMYAEEIFGATRYGRPVKVWAEGRSGGWAVVDGLKDFEEWDAIDLAKWRKFERMAKAEAADVPYQMVMLAYLNVWEAEKDEAAEAEAAAKLGIPTITPCVIR